MRLTIFSLLLGLITFPLISFSQIDTSKIQSRIEFEKGSIMVGQPEYFYFIIKNNSDADIYVKDGGDYRNRLGRHQSFDVKIFDPANQELEKFEILFSGGGFTNYVNIKPNKETRFRLFLNNWATIEVEGEHQIQVSKIFDMTLYDPFQAKEYNEVEKIFLKSVAKFNVNPLDKKKMGVIIKRLGKQLLEKDNWEVRSKAMRKLANINDVRTIPFFTEIIRDTVYTSLIQESVRALSKYVESESALDAIVFAATITHNRFTEYTHTPEMAIFDAKTIRLVAIRSVSGFTGKKVIDFLISHKDDKYDEVRISLMDNLYEIDVISALPILKQYKTDKNMRVRKYARNYLKDIEENKK